MFDHNRKHILRFMIGLLMLGASGPTRAGTLESFGVATALGDVLGSESFCSLHYNQDAIKKFIDEHVDKNDLEFTSTLKMMTSGSQYQNRSMSPSEKTAHCAQITRVARSYGFIP
jgi:hypothetical protein